MNTRKFAEALMIQCIDDLFERRHLKQSLDFFAREGFHQVAAMAGMSAKDCIKLLEMLSLRPGYRYDSARAHPDETVLMEIA